MILLVTVPNITRTLQRNSENDYKRFIEELELATETYLSFHKSTYPQISEVGGVALVKMKELIDYGIVDFNLMNPETKEKIHENDLMVARKNEDGVLEYTFLVADREDNEITMLGVKDEIYIAVGESYDFLNGVTAIDLGNNVVTNITVSIEDSSTLAEGTYELIYKASYDGTSVQKKTKLVVVKMDYVFEYTGSYQEFKAPMDGTYKVELWGASDFSNVGKGSYVLGELTLKREETFYVFVGSKGIRETCAGGYNGGGTGNTGYWYSSGGGGATDIRTYIDSTGAWNNIESLRSRIMVAGGGGSGYGGNTTGEWGAVSGGTLNGNASARKYVGQSTQTSSGAISSSPSSGTTRGSFGVGGNGGIGSEYGGGGAGGGGYYGGSGGSGHAGGNGQFDGGASGSSYISGYLGCVAVTSQNDTTPKAGCSNGTTDITCSHHYSGYIFKNAVMKAGNDSTVPTHDQTEDTAGNGYAKITLLFD